MLLNTTRFVRMSENEDIGNAKIIVLGVPFDGTETSFPGQRFAPDEIRKSLLTLEIGKFSDHVYDAGNVNIVHGDVFKSMERIGSALEEVWSKNKNARYVILGGEHTITYACVRFFVEKYGKLQLIWMDAHGDCYEEYNGLKMMHATVLRRISEIKDVEIATAGIRAEYECLSHIKTYKLEELDRDMLTYVSIDMDVFDPSLVKSIADPVPNGIDFREAIEIIKKFRNVVGVDIVEMNPLIENHTGPRMAAWLSLKIMEMMLNEEKS